MTATDQPPERRFSVTHVTHICGGVTKEQVNDIGPGGYPLVKRHTSSPANG